jgi:iron complex transport system ATP-binding protein
MDEPTAHLDFRNELFFLETVVRLVRDQNVGVLMATHSPNQAFYFEGNGVPTTCVLMEGGKARFAGAPTEVLTSDNLRGLYGIQAQVIEARIDDSRTFSQLLLVETEDVRHE